MNILVISGGSGNDSLITGIKKIYPDADIKVLVNAYDAGKSTGICRRVTNTLGVSDIRKNHIRMYKSIADIPNRCLIEFYDSRFNFTQGNEVVEIAEKLSQWGMESFIPVVQRFFEQPTALNYEYKDFNISNIVYSQLYSEAGYEQTNAFFCDLLGIDDFVILNSFDNVYLKATTSSGYEILDEGELVEWCNPDDPVISVDYVGDQSSSHLNVKAVDALLNADLIVISTGTFWSSIYPTLHYGELYRYFNDAPGKKLWVMNNEPDKDSYGVDNLQFVQYFTTLGLNMQNVTVLLNEDANEILKKRDEKTQYHHEIRAHMGNHNGKHDGNLYAKEVLKFYYGFETIHQFDKFVFDFDDTLWARTVNDPEVDKSNMITSRKNIETLSKLSDKVMIVSGNSYDSIKRKLSTIYGSSLDTFSVDIWADANSACFKRGKRIDVIKELLINGNEEKLILVLDRMYGIPVTKNDEQYTSCLKIKPLSSLDQLLVRDYLNSFLLAATGNGFCVANATGKTTVDVVSKSNSKTAVINHCGMDPTKILYIGDETDNGNDAEIASICGKCIKVKDVKETAAVLSLLEELIK